MKKSGHLMMLIAAVAWLAACGEEVFPIRLAERELPKVDGNLAEHEYDEGVCVPGFLKSSPPSFLKAGNDGTATFLTDGNTLFVVWRVRARNVDIGGGLLSKATARDGAVWADDAVELTIADESKPMHVAHFIINPTGAVYDSMTIAPNKPDVRWNCEGLKVASRVLHGWWVLEVSIPLESIGLFKRGFAVNAARSEPGEGAMSLTAAGAYISGPKIRFDWRKSAAAVGIRSLGIPSDGAWRPEFAFTSGEGSVRADVLLREMRENGGAGKTLFAEGKVLGAGDVFSPSFNTRSRTPILAEMTLRDSHTGEMLLSRTFNAKRGLRTSGVPATAEFDLNEIGEVAAYHYPGQNRIRFTLYPAPDADFDEVLCRLAGKTALFERIGGVFNAIIDTPCIEGSYDVSFEARNDKTGATKRFPRAWSLEKRHFEWEGNDIGKEKIILPPFKPIATSGDGLDVILRHYALGVAGMPKSVMALGRELLAAPAYLELEIEGCETTRFAGTNPQIKVKDGGYSADVVASASAHGVTLTNQGNFEYDGFVWNDMTLRGLAGRTLERLTLIVPLKNSEAPLMHICTTDSIRYNPTGTVPPGEGVVWDGTKLYRKSGAIDDMFAPQCVPYVWLGAERRGLCWFINNTSGLRLDSDKPSVRIVREGGTLRLEIDLVNVPSRLKDGHAFAFGFETTPVKEPDKTLRRHFQSDPDCCPEGMTQRMRVGGGVCGFWNQFARIPHNDDWNMLEWAMKHAGTGKFRNEFDSAYISMTNRYDAEMAVYAANMPKKGKQTYFNWMQTCRDYSYKTIRSRNGAAYPFAYSDPTLTWEDEAAEKYYKSEWISRSTGYIGATRNFLVPSYMDYILYYYKKQIEKGLKGLYFDDMFPMTCRNPDTSMVRDSTGRWHGNFGILEMRELVKRAAVMQHLAGVSPRFIQIHMTNCLLVPAFAFATSMLSWEDHFGEEIFQKRFSVDYMRAESLGTQVGAEAVALDGIHRRKHDAKDWGNGYFRFLTRTQQALLLPAGVKTWVRPAIPGSGVDRKELISIYTPLARFGIWEDDCEFKAFYDDDGAVSGAPHGTLVASYRRPGRVLVLFGNSGGDDVTFAVNIDHTRLGLPADVRAYDAETGEPLADGQVRLKGWDLAMVLFAGEAPSSKGVGTLK